MHENAVSQGSRYVLRKGFPPTFLIVGMGGFDHQSSREGSGFLE